MSRKQVRGVGLAGGVKSERDFQQSLEVSSFVMDKWFQFQGSASSKGCAHCFHVRGTATCLRVTGTSPGLGPGPLTPRFSHASNLNGEI